MRLISVFCCLLVLVTSLGLAQPVKSTPAQITCETLCGELFTSIRAEPDKLVMRLEEALVIHEACAGEIVTAAIDAVNAEPGQVRKIVETAMDLAPARAAMITAAVKHYTAPVIVAAAEEQLEVRRAVVPAAAPPKPMAGEQVRRAELPLQTRSIPIVEVRRAEPAASMEIEFQEPEPPMKLTDVPKAKPMK
ncbi:MAG: hypothetical protein B7Z37_12645 [Verrucomicrobia bacterium 12-59-8]|nr:MAG: hypothetical protein B7Z37_12645 [Verrucomicrobia bacterium 12-59-8]